MRIGIIGPESSCQIIEKYIRQLDPEVEVKDYKGIELEKVDAEVTDEDVNTEIENLRKRNARISIYSREGR